MRISDWSSDVCSSDLRHPRIIPCPLAQQRQPPGGRDREVLAVAGDEQIGRRGRQRPSRADRERHRAQPPPPRPPQGDPQPTRDHQARSEEHTSELQSLMRISYAVFCLKKKNTQTKTDTPNTDKSYIDDKTHTRKT